MAGLAALAIAYVLSQFYRSFLAVLTPALATDLGATNTQLSMALGAWFVAFGFAQFIVGVSLDRYGPRRTASVLLAIGGGGGALLFASASEPWMIIAAMALIGIGCAPVLMASAYIFARSFNPARMAILTSFLIGFGSAGNVLGATPLAIAAETFGWRMSMVALGAVTLLTAAAVIFLVRDPEPVAGQETADTGFAGYLELLRLRVLWPLLPLVGLNYAAAAGIRGMWAGPYVADVYGADVMVIGQVTLFMALAMVVGNFIYGPLDTLFGTRKWVAVFGNLIGMTALACLAIFPVTTITIATTLFMIVGTAGASYALLMAHGRAFLPPHMIGRGMTMLNFFSIGGVGAMQFISGAVFAASDVPGEPAAAYATLFWFYIVTTLAALAIYLFVRDAKPEKKPVSESIS